jgi:hypothetical protein
MTWESVFDTIERFRILTDNWDGAGGLPPPPSVIADALASAKRMQDAGVEPPDRVHVSVNASIYFEWHDKPGEPARYFEYEVCE